MENLRAVILDVAGALDQVEELEGTLKWDESSYIGQQGTTIRIDWKEKAPDEYAMFFNCQSSLIPTIKIVFGTLYLTNPVEL